MAVERGNNRRGGSNAGPMNRGTALADAVQRILTERRGFSGTAFDARRVYRHFVFPRSIAPETGIELGDG
jgi:hypothetical protein